MRFSFLLFRDCFAWILALGVLLIWWFDCLLGYLFLLLSMACYEFAFVLLLLWISIVLLGLVLVGLVVFGYRAFLGVGLL